MKKELLWLLLGGLISICLASSAKSLVVIKPPNNKLTIAIPCNTKYAADFINTYSKKGYNFKSYTAASTYDRYGLLVMEKYK